MALLGIWRTQASIENPRSSLPFTCLGAIYLIDVSYDIVLFVYFFFFSIHYPWIFPIFYPIIHTPRVILGFASVFVFLIFPKG